MATTTLVSSRHPTTYLYVARAIRDFAARPWKWCSLKRWWLERDKGRIALAALAALDDDQLSNLSEIGCKMRRDARRGRCRT
jgi:hypothetical protein